MIKHIKGKIILFARLKMKRFYIIITILAMFIGCNRSNDHNPSNSSGLSTNSLKGGKVDFKIISKIDTIRNGNGGYNDNGHYSIIYQAKREKNGMPISGLDSDDFYTMYENDKQIDESKLHILQDSKTVSNKILLLLDFSGSIVDDCSKPDASNNENNLCYQIVDSSKKFIDKIISDNQTMSIYYFNSQRKPMPLSDNAQTTNDVTLLKSSLEKLYDPVWREEYLEGYNSTNLYGAIKVAADEIVCDWFQDCEKGKSSKLQVDGKNHYDFATIVVFTDGRHTVGNNVSLTALLSDLKLYERNYYYTIGLGKNVEDDVLKKIGEDGYFKATQTDKLDNEFERLGERLNSFANSFYKINYCPAQQGGRLDLKIEMKDRERGYYGTLLDTIDLIDNVDFRCDIK
jgi:hypothetical protein